MAERRTYALWTALGVAIAAMAWMAGIAAASIVAATLACLLVAVRVLRRPRAAVVASSPAPAERAEERMYAVRHALLQQAHEELKAESQRRLSDLALAVAQLERDLAAARASAESEPPVPGADDDESRRRITVEFDVVRSERDAARAEVASLRARAEEAEAAVRVALRELGADPARWPLTAAGVVRAAAPLTLYALGEDTPDWRSEPGDDTLAAAVVRLRRRDEWLAYSANEPAEGSEGESENGRE